VLHSEIATLPNFFQEINFVTRSSPEIYPFNLLTIQFQYTPETLQRAHELHYKKFIPLQGRLLLYLGLLSAWAGVLLLLVKGGGNNLWFSLPLILYGIIAVISHIRLTRTIGKRAYKKLSDYHDPMTMEIGEENVSLIIGDHRNVIPWSDFKKALITEEMVLLYPNEKIFFIFPEKNFAGEEYSSFCELVKTKVEKVY